MFTVRMISAEATRVLRHKILRPHQSFSQTLYPLDSHVDTGHSGVFSNDQLIGISSIFHENREGHLATGVWRVRGMAVLDQYRGQGVGKLALEQCIQYASDLGMSEVWCNARSSAAQFYVKCGFEVLGDEFDLPGLGPHYILKKKLIKS